MGLFASIRADTQLYKASRALSIASASLLPSDIQPGKSGKVTSTPPPSSSDKGIIKCAYDSNGQGVITFGTILIPVLLMVYLLNLGDQRNETMNLDRFNGPVRRNAYVFFAGLADKIMTTTS